jgi:hypothetical protein
MLEAAIANCSGGPMEIPDISSHLAGIYERVAHQLGLDPIFVRQVACGEQESKQVEEALRQELSEIAKHYKPHSIQIE